MKQLHANANTLRARLFALQTNERAMRLAEQQAKDRERDRLAKARDQQAQEKKVVFEQLITTLFKKWSGKLWRSAQPYVLKWEIVS